MIDFRIRPPYKSFLSMKSLFTDFLPKSDASLETFNSIGRRRMKSAIYKSMDYFMDEMDEAGVDYGVLMGRRTNHPIHGNINDEDIYELCNRYPDRFIGFLGVDPHEGDSIERMENAAKNWGFKGVGIDAGWCSDPLYVDDPIFDPIYEACCKYNLIASLTCSVFMGPDISYCDPIHIQHVAQRFPELKIVVPHACWPLFDRAIGVCLTCPNIWLMPDAYFYMDMPFARELAHAADGFLKQRVVYASIYPGIGLKEGIERWSAMPLEKDTLLNTLHYNAHKLLGLN